MSTGSRPASGAFSSAWPRPGRKPSPTWPVRQREQRVFGALSPGVSKNRLREATDALMQLREAMESPAWDEVVRREARR
jgi:hypothetical protein